MLRSLECGEKIPPRRLSRTLSTRAYADSRPQSTLATRNYLPLTRRSLSLLETAEGGRPTQRRLSSSASDKYNYNYRPLKSSSLLVDRPYQGSASSDCGDYVGYSALGTTGGNVLPPIPSTLSSHRRRDPKRSYSQQFSSENECVGRKKEPVQTNGDIKHDNLAKSESSQTVKNFASKENCFEKHASSHLTGGVTLNSSSQNVVNDTENNILPTSKNETDNNSKLCEINSLDQCKRVSSSGSSKDNLSSAAGSRCDNLENKHRSQIPSLLRFRSLSVSRELDPAKSKKEALACGCSTPEKSILSKFFKQGSEDRLSGGVSGNEGKEKKKSGSGTRRISRFLRPDFFDTPREESEYVRQKEAKKSADAEEKALARKKKITEKHEAAKKVSDTSKVVNSDTSKVVNSDTSKVVNSDTTAKKVSTSKRSLNTKKSENPVSDSGGKEEKKIVTKKVDSNVKEDKIEKKDVVNNASRKGDKAKAEAFVKQAGKNSFLHSLEKRLEKFCSSGDGAVPANVKNSRVDKAIRSLRESSVAPPSSATAITESNLLKRAVSADDCSSLASSPASASGTSKVNSVLGLFRRLEGTSTQHNNQSLPQRPKRPTSMIVDQVKRSQAPYTGSHSDSVLLSQALVNSEGKVQGSSDQSDTKDIPTVSVPAAGKGKAGKIVSGISKPISKNVVVGVEQEQDTSSLVLNKNEAQVTEIEKDKQPITKEAVQSRNVKSIPRPTSLKGLKESVVENTTPAPKYLVSEKEIGNSKQRVPEVNSKLLERRPETAQQLDERRKCLELPSPADEAPSLVSPGDESGSQSFDSWSVSSDLEGRENLSSPIPPYLLSDGIEESVGERIRRKSFYSRFNNTGKKPRKSSVPVLSPSYSSNLHDPSNTSQSRTTPARQIGSRVRSSRSNSLYAEDNLPSYGRKSPIPNRGYYSQYGSDLMNNVGSVDVNDNLQNGFSTDRDDRCISPDYSRVPHLDGSYLGDYSPYTCRTTERRLSRPTDFIKDLQRSSSLLPGLYSSLRAPSSVCGYADSLARYRLPEGEVYQLGKYSRYNSHSGVEPPSNTGPEESPADNTPEQKTSLSND